MAQVLRSFCSGVASLVFASTKDALNRQSSAILPISCDLHNINQHAMTRSRTVDGRRLLRPASCSFVPYDDSLSFISLGTSALTPFFCSTHRPHTREKEPSSRGTTAERQQSTLILSILELCTTPNTAFWVWQRRMGVSGSGCETVHVMCLVLKTRRTVSGIAVGQTTSAKLRP